jgi:hypothetical protein
MVTFLANRKVMKNKNKCVVESVFPFWLETALTSVQSLPLGILIGLNFISCRDGLSRTVTLTFVGVFNNFRVTLFILQETLFPHILPYLLPLIHIALTGSVYTTIAVAMERCVTVMAPFTKVKVSKYFQFILSFLAIIIIKFSKKFNMMNFL